MKKNHNRGFEARPEAKSQSPEGRRFYWRKSLQLSGVSIETRIHPNGGTHSEEKCRRGAKRHINRVARKYENAATRKLAENPPD